MMTLKSHIDLWSILACNLHANERTLNTFVKLCEQGHPFLTQLMPALGKDLERGLTTGFLCVTSSFKIKRGTNLPVFLYEFFIRIFEKDGLVRDKPEGIGELRQLLMLFYKFEMPFSPEMEKKAYDKFAATDALVKTSAWPATFFTVRGHFRTLLPDDPWDIRPHHSSGATADSVSNSNKRVIRRRIPSLHDVYGFEYFFQNYDHAQAWSKTDRLITAEPKSKVTLVPKDSRGPRIICMEPHERMFIQKGLMSLLYTHIEEVSPAKGYINFTNQEINRSLARSSSVDCKYATIDLKDASDMVSWNLIKKLVTPDWLVALTATRSTHASLPDSTLEFKKFAPMGSALCFPIEAMLFYSIGRSVSDEVYVYGDDMIVPRIDAENVIKALESYGLLVNHDKTLLTGLFRESCGGEYYCGVDISYIKCKSYSLPKFVAFCNLITERYGIEISEQLIAWYENTYDSLIFRKPFRKPVEGSYFTPEVERPEWGVFFTNRLSSRDVFFKRRWNVNLQVHEYRYLAERCERIVNKDLTQYDEYFDALTQSSIAVQPEIDHRLKRISSNVFPRSYRYTMPSETTESDVRDTKPRTKFVWGSAY